MSIGDANCLKSEYRFEESRNEKGQVTSVKTVFSKSFLRERNRQYDPRANRYVKKEIFGGIS